MECREANRMIEPFLNNTLGIRDTSAYLRHLEGCPSCRKELDLEAIFRSATDPSVTEDTGYDFSHQLEDMIRKKQETLRACILTWCLDAGLLLAAAAAVLVKILQ